VPSNAVRGGVERHVANEKNHSSERKPRRKSP
jgi:hypothetical protein